MTTQAIKKSLEQLSLPKLLEVIAEASVVV